MQKIKPSRKIIQTPQVGAIEKSAYRERAWLWGRAKLKICNDRQNSESFMGEESSGTGWEVCDGNITYN